MTDQAQGNGSPNQPQGQGAPGAFTPEQLEQISQVAAQVVNSGFTARTKKLREEIMGDLGKGLEPLSKRLDELMSAPSGKTGKKPKDGDEPDSSSPEYRGMQRRLEELQKTVEDREKRLADAEQRQRVSNMRTTLVKNLAEAGFTDAERADLAADHLIGKGLVRLDDDGNPVFYENENSVLDLATGVKAFTKTNVSKIFLPPSGARGSGDRPGQGAPRAPQTTGEVSATDLGLALVREYGGIPVGT